MLNYKVLTCLVCNIHAYLVNHQIIIIAGS